jgi:hypothetical protein
LAHTTWLEAVAQKIDGILQMDRPKTPKELHKFIGMVNYYRDIWPSRAHILKPLSDMD